MKVYAVRHTSLVVDGREYCYGFTDIDVKDSFVDEASKTLEEIEKIGEVDAVFTSPLIRAKKLADFCNYTDATKDDRIKELNFGDWEMKPWKELLQDISVEDFFKKYLDKRVPNGESLNEQKERVWDFLKEQKEKDYKKIIVFCHGGVINAMKVLSEKFDAAETFATIPDFGSVTELEF